MPLTWVLRNVTRLFKHLERKYEGYFWFQNCKVDGRIAPNPSMAYDPGWSFTKCFWPYRFRFFLGKAEKPWWTQIRCCPLLYGELGVVSLKAQVLTGMVMSELSMPGGWGLVPPLKQNRGDSNLLLGHHWVTCRQWMKPSFKKGSQFNWILWTLSVSFPQCRKGPWPLTNGFFWSMMVRKRELPDWNVL